MAIPIYSVLLIAYLHNRYRKTIVFKLVNFHTDLDDKTLIDIAKNLDGVTESDVDVMGKDFKIMSATLFGRNYKIKEYDCLPKLYSAIMGKYLLTLNQEEINNGTIIRNLQAK